MKINFENIPRQMKEEGFFCLHKDKIPRTKNHYTFKKCIDEEGNFNEGLYKRQFSSFEEIRKAQRIDEGVGIGLFNSLCGIDLDHCFKEGKLSKLALDILKKINSYTEKSLSGEGLHIYFKMKPEEQISINKEKYFTKNSKIGLEIYQGTKDNRYLTLTGNKFLKNDELREISKKELQSIFDDYMKKPEINYQNNYTTMNYNSISSDRNFLQEALERKTDDKLIQLWNSTPSGSGGNESETDQALMNKLAYYCNKNEILMIQAFESSPYFQQKDDYHLKKWNRDDYKQTTISNAIKCTNETALQKEIDFVNKQKEREQFQKQNNQSEEPSINLEELSSYNRIETFFQKVENGAFKPTPTKFKRLDEIFNGGFLNQSLITLGGGTSTGKTTFALNLALNLCKERTVLYYTLEMGEEMIQAKIFSNLLYTGGGLTIASDKFLKCYDKNIVTDYQKSRMREELAKHKELNQLFIRYPLECKIEYIMKEATKINQELEKQGKEKAILFIDYLQYLQGEAREDTQATIKRIQKHLKQYTIDNNSIVILLIANSRNANIEGTETTISSGRDSSDIEYSSDYNLQLNFTEWERGENRDLTRNDLIKRTPRRMTITIHKNRMGSTGEKVDFLFNPITNTYTEKETNSSEIERNDSVDRF